MALWRALDTAPDGGPEAWRYPIWGLVCLAQVAGMRSDRSGEALMAGVHALGDGLDDRRMAAELAFAHGRGLLHQGGQAVAARALLLEAQAAFRQLGDSWSLAQVLIDLGMLALGARATAAARGWCGEALAAARPLKDRALEALAHNNLGEAARLAGNDAAAAAHYEAGLRLYRALDSRTDIPRLVHNLGYRALHAGDTALARARFAESPALFRAADQGGGLAEALAGLAAVAAQGRSPAASRRAARLWAVASPSARAIMARAARLASARGAPATPECRTRGCARHIEALTFYSSRDIVA